MRPYETALMNDVSWLMRSFTWKSLTTGLPRRHSKARARIQQQPSASLRRGASLTFQPFRPLTPLTCLPTCFLIDGCFFIASQTATRLSPLQHGSTVNIRGSCGKKQSITADAHSLIHRQGCIAFTRLGLFWFTDMFLIAADKAKGEIASLTDSDVG